MEGISKQQAARIAGAGYLIIFVLAIFANFLVFEPAYVAGNAQKTTSNILQNTQLFRLGIMSFLIVTMTDIIIAWALNQLFMERNKAVSQLAMVFRIANAVLFAAAISFLYIALQTSVQGLEAQTLLHMETFHTLWMIALFGFGIHLLLIAFLLFKQSRVQTILAVLLTMAGLAYMLDTTTLLLSANYAAYAGTFLAAVAVPGIVGELGFTLWILTQGFLK